MKDITKRIKDIYGNWLVLHPKGFEMFRCTNKKAEWYLSRNLANIVIEDPPTIQLNFTPRGNGWETDEYHLTQKHNKCVVCGTEELERLTRHHIIPSLYKKHYPKNLKVANSHDVVCICRECHDEYENVYALRLKQKISEQYGIPLCNSQSDFAKAIKLSKAYILNGALMPDERKLELLLKISLMLGHDDEFISIEEVEKFSMIDKKSFTEFYNNHGRDVISKIDNLQSFSEMWRNDFIVNMKPKFMPEYWDVYRPIYKQRTVLKTK